MSRLSPVKGRLHLSGAQSPDILKLQPVMGLAGPKGTGNGRLCRVPMSPTGLASAVPSAWRPAAWTSALWPSTFLHDIPRTPSCRLAWGRPPPAMTLSAAPARPPLRGCPRRVGYSSHRGRSACAVASLPGVGRVPGRGKPAGAVTGGRVDFRVCQSGPSLASGWR